MARYLALVVVLSVAVPGFYGDKSPLSIVQQCKNMGGIGRIRHDNCQMYYDCETVYESIPPYFEQHLTECKYPQLYDTQMQLCDDFEKVDCGDRTEFVDACDYSSNKCAMGHCSPCWLHHPSCKNLEDGKYGIYKPTHYKVCRTHRLIELVPCGTDQTGEHLHFDLSTKTCQKPAH